MGYFAAIVHESIFFQEIIGDKGQGPTLDDIDDYLDALPDYRHDPMFSQDDNKAWADDRNHTVRNITPTTPQPTDPGDYSG